MEDRDRRDVPLTGTVETRAGTWGYRSSGTDGPEWRAWTWTSRRHSFSWLGALLVMLGIALLVQQLVPDLTLGSLLLFALGVALAVAWLAGGLIGATAPALGLTAWALARMAVELGYLEGEGWTPLFVGAALLAAWLIGRAQGARREWALWLGLLLGVVGLAQASDALPGVIDWGVVVPLGLILLGGLLILRRRAT